MEGLKQEYNEKKQQQKAGGLLTFITGEEIEKARQEIALNQIDDSQFSDGEIILALQRQKEIGAATVIPIVLDWLIQQNFIMSGAQAVNYLLEHTTPLKGYFKYKVVGEAAFDANGKYYLIQALNEAKQEKFFYKVHTDGTISQFWVE